MLILAPSISKKRSSPLHEDGDNCIKKLSFFQKKWYNDTKKFISESEMKVVFPVWKNFQSENNKWNI